ncbi:MAG: hypothetical protein RLZZ630_256 [Bacteroidota bacterium]|jgi:PAS domain S-box-containing protein
MIRHKILDSTNRNLPGAEWLQVLQIPAMLLDRDGRILYANPLTARLAGDLLPLKDQRFEDVFASEIPFTSRLKLLDASQEPLRFSLSLHIIPVDQFQCVLSAHHNQNDTVYLLQIQSDLDLEKSNFYKSILENIPADVAVLDKDQRYLYVNPSAIRDPEMRAWMIGKTDLDYARYRNLPETLALLRQSRFGQILEGGIEEYTFEESIERDATPHNFLRMMKAVRNDNGTLRYAVGYGVNIDQLKGYESRIQNQEVAIEASTVGIALLNPQGEYTYLNRAHVTMYGFQKQEQLLGKTWHELYSPEEIRRIEEDVFPLYGRDGKWTGETVGRKVGSDGLPIVTELNLTALPDGGMVCVCRDISKRKQNELETQRLAIVAAKTNNLVVISRPDASIEWVNEAFVYQTGFRLEDICGKRPAEFLIGSETDPDTVAQIRDCLSSLQPFSGEVLLYHKNGSKTWYFMNATPAWDKKNQVQNWVVVLTNISILKDAEERVRKALQKEMQLGELKSKFVSMASHEFRTPLAGIVTSIDLVRLILEKDGQLNDSVERHLDKAMGEIYRLTHLMDNLLLSGKVDQGKIAFKPVRQDFKKFLQEYTDEVMVMWPSRTIKIEVAQDAVVADFDDKLMRHVLSNLLSNAFKYSPANTPVRVKLKSTKTKVCIDVIDQGIGIPRQEINQLFQSFYRASNAEHIDGTGMGLVIVRQFVELHGGTVKINSEENHGCSVEICIPLKSTNYE